MAPAFVGGEEGHGAVGQGDELAVEEVAADGVGEGDPGPRGRRGGGGGAPQRDWKRSAIRWWAAGSRKAFSWLRRRVSFPVLMTSLWKTPASMASGDCWRKRRRSSGRSRSRARARGGLEGLAGGVFLRAGGVRVVGVEPVGEEVEAGLTVGGAEAGVVGSSFVVKEGGGVEGGVAGEEGGSPGRPAGGRAVVAGASMERWKFEARLAGTRWSLPSRVSGPGARVAALAVHMAEEEEQAARRWGAWLADFVRISAGVPVKPSRRRVSQAGRRWGGRKAWGRPSFARRRVLSSP